MCLGSRKNEIRLLPLFAFPVSFTSFFPIYSIIIKLCYENSTQNVCGGEAGFNSHGIFFIRIGQRLLEDIFISGETRKYGYISFYEPIGLTWDAVMN